MANKEGKTKILNVKNLTTVFRSDKKVTTAVNNISFSVFKGETLGIVGESGSGKSVTSLSIMRLLVSQGKTENGEVLYHEGDNATDLLSIPEKAMQKYRGNKIAMIFQEPMTSLNPSHRCGRQVAEIIQIHRGLPKQETRSIVLELFKKVQLKDPSRIHDAYPHELSGGQLQRVMIAMAIANSPNILIADEPTTALDVTVQKSILELLVELKRESGNSTIFISHDLGVISEICDRVLVMKDGEIVESGKVNDVFLNPKHPYTKGLIACRPPLDHRMKRLPTVSDFLNKPEMDEKSFINDLRESASEFEANLNTLKEKDYLLEVDHLSKWYPVRKSLFGKVTEHVKAVDDVSFKLRFGETLGLVGESGCGKSTLGRTILRLIDATGGKVTFDKNDIFSLDNRSLKKLRKDFQIIFQDPYSSLNPRMKIGKAIREPMDVHNIFDSKEERKDKVIELLETVGMEADHYERYPHEFSGGQRQRICIARTLSMSPKFIVCDECVSALDVSVQAQVLNLLSELKEKFDLSYIFISHDLSVVKHISDNIMVMEKGKIVEYSDAESIYNSPENDYTKKLIEAIPKGRF